MGERSAFLTDLNQRACEAYQAIAGKERLTLVYQPDVKSESLEETFRRTPRLRYPAGD